MSYKKDRKKHFRRKRRTMVAAALVTGCSLLLGGCRNSPVLTEIIYTDDVSKVDSTQQQLQNTQSKKRSGKRKNKKAESDTKRDTEKKKAVQEQTADEQKQKTTSVEQNRNTEDTAGNSEEAQKKNPDSGGNGSRSADKKSGGSEEKDRNGEQADKTGNGIQKGKKADPETKGKNGKGKTEEKNSDVNGTGEEEKKDGNKITVTDGEGRKVKIPENVEKVTAAGAAAPMVEMIAGRGRLLASSASFTESSIAETVFGKKEVSAVKQWWSGDGKSGISSSDFRKLLKESPDICLEFSGEDTFSNTQIRQLRKKGIAYLALPALDSREHLEEAVTIVGEIFRKTSGVKGAAAKARAYTDWVEDTAEEVKGRVSGEKYSVYIAAYASDISYTLKHTNNDLPAAAELTDGKRGKGVAIAWSESKPELVSTFMKIGGVTNESSRYSRYAATEGLYVSPMFHQFEPTFSSDAFTYYGGNNIAISADLFVTHRITDGYYYLGSEEFPGIIVADEKIGKQIRNNWFWKYHGGAKVKGEADWPAGYKSDSGRLYYGSVIADYDIYVNPSGLGDWAEGSVESPLEAYWAANRFSDGSAYSDSDVINRTEQFYSKFFDADLSDAQIKEILHFQ